MRFPGRQIFAKNISRGAVVALAIGFFATLAAMARAQTETVLYNFCSLANCTDGWSPNGNIVRDAAGNIYGTTTQGGQYGMGVLYSVSPSGVETILHNFGSTASDGQGPNGLATDSAGNLYGTTAGGGTHLSRGSGLGTVFKLTPDGAYSILYNFGATSTDGVFPEAGVAVDVKGNLYGTTEYGGDNGVGTVFKLASGGKETVLHSFDDNRVDGYLPFTPPTLDKTGNAYGVSAYGGRRDVGLVYEVSSAGAYTIRYDFGSAPAGAVTPYDGVTLDAVGNLYGTTTAYDYNYLGAIYEISPGSGEIWTETVVLAFTSSEGQFPVAGVTFDSAGNLYGTTLNGGTLELGTVFELTAGGEFITLFNFDNTHGENPNNNLVLDSSGNLYGTTTYGGSGNALYGGGVLYEVTP
jgi:uncharacterized repeat protein (TIGR03803 family)